MNVEKREYMAWSKPCPSIDHRVYLYLDGGFPAGTIRIVEINLLSGVGPGMFKVEKVDEGTVFQLEVYWPQYFVEPRTLNGKHLNRRSMGYRFGDGAFTVIGTVASRNNRTP